MLPALFEFVGQVRDVASAAMEISDEEGESLQPSSPLRTGRIVMAESTAARCRTVRGVCARHEAKAAAANHTRDARKAIEARARVARSAVRDALELSFGIDAEDFERLPAFSRAALISTAASTTFGVACAFGARDVASAVAEEYQLRGREVACQAAMCGALPCALSAVAHISASELGRSAAVIGRGDGRAVEGVGARDLFVLACSMGDVRTARIVASSVSIAPKDDAAACESAAALGDAEVIDRAGLDAAVVAARASERGACSRLFASACESRVAAVANAAASAGLTGIDRDAVRGFAALSEAAAAVASESSGDAACAADLFCAVVARVLDECDSGSRSCTCCRSRGRIGAEHARTASNLVADALCFGASMGRAVRLGRCRGGGGEDCPTTAAASELLLATLERLAARLAPELAAGIGAREMIDQLSRLDGDIFAPSSSPSSSTLATLPPESARRIPAAADLEPHGCEFLGGNSAHQSVAKDGATTAPAAAAAAEDAEIADPGACAIDLARASLEASDYYASLASPGAGAGAELDSCERDYYYNSDDCRPPPLSPELDSPARLRDRGGSDVSGASTVAPGSENIRLPLADVGPRGRGAASGMANAPTPMRSSRRKRARSEAPHSVAPEAAASDSPEVPPPPPPLPSRGASAVRSFSASPDVLSRIAGPDDRDAVAAAAELGRTLLSTAGISRAASDEAVLSAAATAFVKYGRERAHRVVIALRSTSRSPTSHPSNSLTTDPADMLARAVRRDDDAAVRVIYALFSRSRLQMQHQQQQQQYPCADVLSQDLAKRFVRPVAAATTPRKRRQTLSAALDGRASAHASAAAAASAPTPARVARAYDDDAFVFYVPSARSPAARKKVAPWTAAAADLQTSVHLSRSDPDVLQITSLDASRAMALAKKKGASKRVQDAISQFFA
jgi:hypothetical protein